MTDKVIIDYTQCKYYQKGECEAEIDYNGNYCDYTCESDVMNDCYYKQLQRKTQECEKLKEENEKLEKLLTKEPMALQALRAGYTAYKTDTKVFSNLLERYKTALDEIEEICLVYKDNPVEGSAYKKILDIITKEKEQE